VYAANKFIQVNRELRPISFVSRPVLVRISLVLISSFFPFSGATAQQASSPGAAATAATPASATPALIARPPEETPVPLTHEDLISLPVDAASFKVLDAVSGGVEENEKFTRELLQLGWRAGDPVDVWVVLPKGVVNPPVILYLYGYDESLERFKNDRYCERITKGGYAAVGFLAALSGDRFHDRPMKEWFVSELQESLGASVHDVQMVLNYLNRRKDLDLAHAGIFGQGSGGTIAILAAAADSRLKAVDTLNPWGDWNDWLAKSSVIPAAERPSYLKPEFLDKVKPLEPVDWLPKVKATAVRLQFISGIPAVPEESTRKMEAAAAHDTSTVHFTVTRYKDMQNLIEQTDGGKLFDWIKSQLRADSADTGSKAATPSQTKPVQATSASGK